MENIKVVFTGQILPGHDIAEVRELFSKQFKVDGAALENIFDGDEFILKRNLDQATASKLERVLTHFGMQARLDGVEAVPEIDLSAFVDDGPSFVSDDGSDDGPATGLDEPGSDEPAADAPVGDLGDSTWESGLEPVESSETDELASLTQVESDFAPSEPIAEPLTVEPLGEPVTDSFPESELELGLEPELEPELEPLAESDTEVLSEPVSELVDFDEPIDLSAAAADVEQLVDVEQSSSELDALSLEPMDGELEAGIDPLSDLDFADSAAPVDAAASEVTAADDAPNFDDLGSGLSLEPLEGEGADTGAGGDDLGFLEDLDFDADTEIPNAQAVSDTVESEADSAGLDTALDDLDGGLSLEPFDEVADSAEPAEALAMIGDSADDLTGAAIGDAQASDSLADDSSDDDHGMACPKCGHRQAPADECSKCGAIFSGSDQAESNQAESDEVAPFDKATKKIELDGDAKAGNGSAIGVTLLVIAAIAAAGYLGYSKIYQRFAGAAADTYTVQEIRTQLADDCLELDDRSTCESLLEQNWQRCLGEGNYTALGDTKLDEDKAFAVFEAIDYCVYKGHYYE